MFTNTVIARKVVHCIYIGCLKLKQNTNSTECDASHVKLNDLILPYQERGVI